MYKYKLKFIRVRVGVVHYLMVIYFYLWQGQANSIRIKSYNCYVTKICINLPIKKKKKKKKTLYRPKYKNPAIFLFIWQS